MAITRVLVPDSEDIVGKHRVVSQDITLDTSYPNDGYSITAASLGWSVIDGMVIIGGNEASGGYQMLWDNVNYKLLAFRSGAESGTISAPTFTGAAHTLAGTVAAPVFTGTAPLGDLNLATPAFSGTGLTAAGQVITTTDNQTMLENECAGMWLIPATDATAAVLILSNTAVAGAPAVFTVQGTAATDAGTYSVVKNLAPVGTNNAPAFTGESYTPTGTISAPVFTGAAAGFAQVPNGTNLSTVQIRVEFKGV